MVSPHIHSFIWIINTTKLTKESKREYIHWFDSMWKDMPDPVSETELFQLVKAFQVQ